MSALVRTTAIDGWTVAFVAADGEPLFRDLDIAERAGLKDPHDIRRAHRNRGNPDSGQ